MTDDAAGFAAVMAAAEAMAEEFGAFVLTRAGGSMKAPARTKLMELTRQVRLYRQRGIVETLEAIEIQHSKSYEHWPSLCIEGQRLTAAKAALGELEAAGVKIAP